MILERLRTCTYPRCKKEIPDSFLVCSKHWDSVPPEDRYRVGNPLVMKLEEEKEDRGHE